MRKTTMVLPAIAVGLAFTVTACGGDDGGPSTSTPTPTPTPTPSATPTPTPTPTAYYPLPGIFGALGQTSPQTFVMLAIQTQAKTSGWDFIQDYSTAKLGPLADLRLDAANQLLLTLPEKPETALTDASGGMSQAPDGRIVEKSFRFLGGSVYIGTPSKPSGGYYASAGTGAWTSAANEGREFPYDYVQFVYGIAPSASAIPATGSWRYRTRFEFVQDIVVDFGTGRVEGTVVVAGGARNFTFSDVMLTPDRMGFKGTLVDGPSGATGSIEGRFVGTNADEVIAVVKVEHPTGPVTITLVGERV